MAESRHLAELVMAYSEIGHRKLPYHVNVVGVLPQTGPDIAAGRLRFLIEGPILPECYFNLGEAIMTLDMDALEARANR